ncbi:serine/threonine-protein kinase D6PKL2-like [Andrographis paniculata]|uniref:serine/threonine-protein kinase D6PKL2-like n=1 Tax=Andrographis paniculata TaxID=175694 RepID=UPI0021E80B7F|nr:serine/threonine-protein kinase D6PKL2-like [Andrographis paniculata]
MDPHLSPDDIADDFLSMSFNSTTTATTTTTDIHRSTSSGSDWTNSSSATPLKPHYPSGDPRWDSIRRFPSLSFSDLRFLHRLGAGDIGSVYLAELKPPPPPSSETPKSAVPGAVFAAKIMDKKELASRNKGGRARTEKEILEMVEHPFLPTLYAAIDSPKWSCLLTEFCPGGDLHVLRQRQPCRRFAESAVRFYASEVVVALEYIHMMGIVYRDLKPENVLVRSDGHIMLTDFDLSLRCDESTYTPAQVISGAKTLRPNSDYAPEPDPRPPASCILPNCIVPAVSCFHTKRRRKKKWRTSQRAEAAAELFVAEPIDVRSMSFVGTHEYLAPEIVSGEGHGSAVDWWTLGIFIYELFYGATPFRGADHEMTLANIVARALEFPKEASGTTSTVISSAGKDLITQLLAKDPERRLGSMIGAAAVKRHPFFEGVNWALLRCAAPPYVPPEYSRDDAAGGGCFSSDESCSETHFEYY